MLHPMLDAYFPRARNQVLGMHAEHLDPTKWFASACHVLVLVSIAGLAARICLVIPMVPVRRHVKVGNVTSRARRKGLHREAC